MNHLTNDRLIENTKRLVNEERAKTLEVIAHLQEIYDRRLHLERGFASLHEFLVKELSYSDGAAHRRISAMRLINDVPETREFVADGSLSLTTAASVQGFFRAEAQAKATPGTMPRSYSNDQKLEVIAQVIGASKQECEKKLQELSPAYAARSKTLALEQDEELLALIREYRLLAMLSDGRPHAVIKAALKAGVAALKVKAVKKTSADRLVAKPKQISPEKLKQAELKQASPEKLKQADPKKASLDKLSASSPSRYVPIKDKRFVWQRDQARCCFVDPRSKRRCTATHALQIDHLIPYVFDGPSKADNLRLLCRAHNQLRARQEFGVPPSAEVGVASR